MLYVLTLEVTYEKAITSHSCDQSLFLRKNTSPEPNVFAAEAEIFAAIKAFPI
jgi:hypothetical protein